MIRDFIEIMGKCVETISSGTLYSVLLGALLLGALCWLGCSRYTRLWHRRFHVRPQHHLLCALAAALTLLFAVLFYAIGNLQFIADEMIDEWSETLVEDDEWNTETYELAFYTVMEMNPSAFVGVPKPRSSGSYIPTITSAMQQRCTEVYVEEACSAFSTRHPFLDKMLSARPGVSEDEILDDMQDYFRRHQGERYPLNRAVTIATDHIREGLLLQSPKTVWKTRLLLVFLFFAVQLIPFGAITYCANEDLKRGKYREEVVHDRRRNDYV